jgi:type I restriction enzyme R subunit
MTRHSSAQSSELLSDHTELFKQFSDNPSFKKWLSETIFAATYADKAVQAGSAATRS